MTSMLAESESTILATCKQTRFHIERPDYRELDIEGLNITVTSSNSTNTVKGKGKAKSDGLELLSNAKLRLKAGQRYALLGRNGSGKSTLLRAIAEKLIPGIPEETRVSILQQTRLADADTDDLPAETPKSQGGRSVFEEVIEKATAKDALKREIHTLSSGVGSSESSGALRALRKLRYERMQKKLFLLDKDARLRSGARGMAARKALVEFEKEVAEQEILTGQRDDEITAEALQAESQEAADLLAELQLQMEPTKVAEIESKAKQILTGLGFSVENMQRPVSSLSGGWRMRTALAVALLQETDILILDEPTNFLDMLGIIWLQRYLQALEDSHDAPTLILVSHDRDFTTLCTDLLILKDKGLTYFHGNLMTYEASQSEKKIYLTKMKDAQEKQKTHLRETIARNMKEGRKKDDENKIRQAKSRQKKLDDRMGLQVSAKGTRFKLNRDLEGHHFTSRAAIEIEQGERPVHVLMPEPFDLRFPGALIAVDKASFSWPVPKGAVKAKGGKIEPAKQTLKEVSLSVNMGDRIGILGLNGAGKSTLIQLLVGAERPTSGTVTTHSRLRLGYYSQHAVEVLQALGQAEPELTALALLMRDVADGASAASAAATILGESNEPTLREGDLRGLLGSVGLLGRTANDTAVRRLSGGQLVRLALARMFWKRPHCLVLDEVTTHLDYQTVGAMREALRDWPGAVVLVSHDRWFMRGAVEGIIDDPDSDSEGRSGEEEEGAEAARRRVIYRLSLGALSKLEGGVSEFEELMEKKVKKLLAV